jgi:hypothetical protein
MRFFYGPSVISDWGLILVLSTLRMHSFVGLAGEFFRAVARAPAHPTHRCILRLHLETLPNPIFGAL